MTLGNDHGLITDQTYERIEQVNDVMLDADFRMINMNIRSINRHFDEFCIFLNCINFKLDLIILTETQMREEAPYHIPGYTFHSRLSNHTSHDGIAIFYNNSTVSEISYVTLNLAYSNCIVMELMHMNKRYCILANYRSPSLKIGYFIQELDTFF
jgi:hypothetical protein